MKPFAKKLLGIMPAGHRCNRKRFALAPKTCHSAWRPARSPSAYAQPHRTVRKLGGSPRSRRPATAPRGVHVLVEAALGFLDVLTDPGPELGPGPELPGKITCSCPPAKPRISTLDISEHRLEGSRRIRGHGFACGWSGQLKLSPPGIALGHVASRARHRAPSGEGEGENG